MGNIYRKTSEAHTTEPAVQTLMRMINSGMKVKTGSDSEFYRERQKLGDYTDRLGDSVDIARKNHGCPMVLIASEISGEPYNYYQHWAFIPDWIKNKTEMGKYHKLDNASPEEAAKLACDGLYGPSAKNSRNHIPGQYVLSPEYLNEAFGMEAVSGEQGFLPVSNNGESESVFIEPFPEKKAGRGIVFRLFPWKGVKVKKQKKEREVFD